MKTYLEFLKIIQSGLTDYLVENSIPLNEAIEVAPILLKAIRRVFPSWRPETLDNDKVQKIDYTGDSNLVDILDSKGKVIKIKIGKILHQLFPAITDNEINLILANLKVKEDENEKYTFKIYSNISEWYSKLYCDSRIKSCMTNKERLTKSLDDDPNVNILICYDKETNKPVGRSLIWFDPKNMTKKLVDRIYPLDDSDLMIAYHDYADEMGWDYRTFNDIANTESISGSYKTITFRFTNPIDSIDYIPFMDTFRYGYDINNHLVVTNQDDDKDESYFWDFQLDNNKNYRTNGTDINDRDDYYNPDINMYIDGDDDTNTENRDNNLNRLDIDMYIDGEELRFDKEYIDDNNHLFVDHLQNRIHIFEYKDFYVNEYDDTYVDFRYSRNDENYGLVRYDFKDLPTIPTPKILLPELYINERIDSIRGLNSTFIARKLSGTGLVRSIDGQREEILIPFKYQDITLGKLSNLATNNDIDYYICEYHDNTIPSRVFDIYKKDFTKLLTSYRSFIKFTDVGLKEEDNKYLALMNDETSSKLVNFNGKVVFETEPNIKLRPITTSINDIWRMWRNVDGKQFNGLFNIMELKTIYPPIYENHPNSDLFIGDDYVILKKPEDNFFTVGDFEGKQSKPIQGSFEIQGYVRSDLFVFRSNTSGKVGVADRNGDIIIEPNLYSEIKLPSDVVLVYPDSQSGTENDDKRIIAKADITDNGQYLIVDEFDLKGNKIK